MNYRGRKGVSVVMRPYANRDGYKMVILQADGRKKIRTVHSLVLDAFVEPRPLGLVCDHIDSDRSNNLPMNLEWVTPTENRRRGRLPETMRGSNHFGSKLTERQVAKIRARYARGNIRYADLADEHGVHSTLIGYIVRREIWTHV